MSAFSVGLSLTSLCSRPENDAASVAGSQQAPAGAGSVKSERNGAGATASGGGNNNANNSATNNGGGGEREGGVKRERTEGGQQPQGKRIKTER